jgi:hypothetical protein
VQKQITESFQYQWPRMRRQGKERSQGHALTVRRKDTTSIEIIGSPISEEQRKEIIQGRLLVWVVAAARYEDRIGTHELQLCRYLGPPFDGSNWIPGETHEGTIDIHEAKIPIQVSYDIAGAFLPLVIPPHAKISILSFTDSKPPDVNLISVKSNPAPILWPSHINAIDPANPQLVGVIAFQNHSSDTVLNVNTMLEAHFKKGAASDTKEKMASLTSSPDIRLPSYLPLTIESLAPGESVPVYVVNQSGNSIILPLPAGGTLEMPGEITKREITFIRRQNNILDSLPPVSGPSPYLWNGDHVVGKRLK